MQSLLMFDGEAWSVIMYSKFARQQVSSRKQRNADKIVQYYLNQIMQNI